MFKCPYCGSKNIKTTGGKNGDPFDRSPEITVCLDCGRTVYRETSPKKVSVPDTSAASLMKIRLEKAQKNGKERK